MKILKFLFLVCVITTTTFGYAHQRIEAIRYSYQIKKNGIALNNLLDRRRELEYNVARLMAPTYLELQLAKGDVKMVLPERWQVYEAAGLREDTIRPTMPQFVRNIVGLFSLKSEAQATPATDRLTEKPY